MVKKFLESIVQTVYRHSYYVNCKRTSVVEIHLCFLGYVPVSPPVVYINKDESLQFK
jgi:hypothetical protein